MITISELAREVGYRQDSTRPLSFRDWYCGYRGDLTPAELADLDDDSPVEDDVAEAIRQGFAEDDES